MAMATVNGVRLFYELDGVPDAVPLVLVHGSWDSHRDWDPVMPGLAEAFQVLRYDRRGHSQSERPTGQGSVREDVDDLAALIEYLELAPVWVVGNSFGASIALRLAGEHPGLLRGIVAHEPPLFSLLAGDPSFEPMLADAQRKTRSVAERIAAGDHAGATEHFVETVALGPGGWEMVPPDYQQVMIENAPTFLDEARDPDAFAFDRDWIRNFSKPILLTLGDQSPPIFALVIALLSEAPHRAEVVTFTDAGHIPHISHPEDYAEAIAAFVHQGIA
ncbi:alpha/beta fold hydrolase [Halomonas salipaludis]|uniref:Alpha/beta hydrolase n=1 Tax=Halomonas salipaludis TaxID=2032625 RepID=A0A2A2F0W0_9GAMM|nr:alpha/beta hydrolase [Halomonas salipaludis]PAU78410.1 alpha/beta hydrolase [Halomonas salipaludis]